MIRNILILLLASQVLNIFGRVTILRGSSSGRTRKLICTAENDGSALVFNDNLIWNSQFRHLDKRENIRFINTDKDCAMDSYEGCMKTWKINNWTITDSLKTPMAPVADQRWEGFKEYADFDSKFNHVVTDNIKPTALSFSFRGEKDAHILFCNGESVDTDFCYWIIIGGWENKKSVIRKCINGVPISIPPEGSECRKERVTVNHTSEPLSATEWRSFIVTWDFGTRNISVYDTKNLIMTYTDTEEITLTSHFENNFHLFIRSNGPMLMRFHIYKFLHTTHELATLAVSDFFPSSDRTVCIQLLVGLCAECLAKVLLIDYETNKLIKVLTVESSAANTTHRLPTWQSIKITETLSENRRWIIIKVISILNSHTANPLWAVANFRHCSSKEFLKNGSMIDQQDYDNGIPGYYWPTVTCQKLFYDKNVVVNSLQTVMKLDIEDCPVGKIGPQCLFSCKDDLNSDAVCRDVAICHDTGCTCSPGFIDQQCSSPCSINSTYGKMCEKKCDTCQLNECNKVTGECNAGCILIPGTFYIPPFCQRSIDNPNAVNIDFINETSIQVSLPVKYEYMDPEIFYGFEIKNNNGDITKQPRKKILQNTTWMTEHFQNLIPGDTYNIICNLYVMNSTLNGIWRSVKTSCYPANVFNVISGRTHVTISLGINHYRMNQYICPANLYHLTIWNVYTNETIITTRITNFPYEVSNLTAYTYFNVTIFLKYNFSEKIDGERKYLFSTIIRTLEGVPSSVTDIHDIPHTKSGIFLTWKPPEQINGILDRYRVDIKAEEYYGCRDRKLFPLESDADGWYIVVKPEIALGNLHPYSNYSARIKAYNSKYGSIETKIYFNIRESEIPTEIFSNMRMDGLKLLWDQPENCTTILGSNHARLKIRGVSDAVKKFELIKDTKYDYYDVNELYGDEQYLIKLYAIRTYNNRENASAYTELLIHTPPKAPGQVLNFDVVENNVFTLMPKNNYVINLRWQKPRPPPNGVLDYYVVSVWEHINLYPKDNVIHLNESCDLWDNYICATITIPLIRLTGLGVVAYNVNVSEASDAAYVTLDRLHDTKAEEYSYSLASNLMTDTYNIAWINHII